MTSINSKRGAFIVSLDLDPLFDAVSAQLGTWKRRVSPAIAVGAGWFRSCLSKGGISSSTALCPSRRWRVVQALAFARGFGRTGLGHPQPMSGSLVSGGRPLSAFGQSSLTSAAPLRLTKKSSGGYEMRKLRIFFLPAVLLLA